MSLSPPPPPLFTAKRPPFVCIEEGWSPSFWLRDDDKLVELILICTLFSLLFINVRLFAKDLLLLNAFEVAVNTESVLDSKVGDEIKLFSGLFGRILAVFTKVELVGPLGPLLIIVLSMDFFNETLSNNSTSCSCALRGLPTSLDDAGATWSAIEESSSATAASLLGGSSSSASNQLSSYWSIVRSSRFSRNDFGLYMNPKYFELPITMCFDWSLTNKNSNKKSFNEFYSRSRQCVGRLTHLICGRKTNVLSVVRCQENVLLVSVLCYPIGW